MYAVMGATGNTGGATAKALLAGGHKVRVIVRSAAKAQGWQAQGAEVVEAALEDVAALAAALRGTDGAYVLMPPFGAAESNVKAIRASMCAAIVQAVAQAKPKHVVALSSIGAQHEAGTGPIADLRPFERSLGETGVPLTLLRAAYFMENWGGSLSGALASGKLYNGLSAAKAFPMVAGQDIGRTAARMLLEPITSGRRVVELSGPREYSLQDAAAAMAKASGKAIEAVQIPISAMVDALVGMGMSKEVAGAFGELTHGVNTDHVVWEGGASLALRGGVSLDEVIGAMVQR